ncbi:MAG: HAMP domain-containing histidine kinase [Planctomycetes bacterium]|nr:HAMP domain-containing histidine kinase [Planctomycetota bacterium]
MRRAQRSKIAGLAVFALITVLVVAGMSWATAATIELARYNVGQEQHALIDRALGRLDSYMGGILNSEAARDHTDYKAFHARRPVSGISEEGWETAPRYGIFPSPILKAGPPHDWIDLYFQVEDGVLTSPQLPKERWRWAMDVVSHDAVTESRARSTWEWFEKSFPLLNLREHAARAPRREPGAGAASSAADHARLVQVAQRTPSFAGGRTSLTRDYQSRERRLQDTQVRHVPLPICETPEIAEINRPTHSHGSTADLDEADPDLTDLEITLGAFAPPFWVEGVPGDRRKLAFVRECVSDATVLYQGFVGDWGNLRKELLEQIEGLFPESVASQVDVLPTSDEAVSDVEASAPRLTQLPAVLSVPYSREATDAAAWQSVRSILVAAWAATLVVLAVAGWGVRNLVALTERRMQFAYAVTHELRTPLTTFRLYADMLSAGMVPEGARQEYLDTLNRESERLTSLVEGVLEYARLENQKARLNPVETNGAALELALRDTLDHRCELAGMTARTRNDIPKDAVLRTDADVLKQVLGVLVNNSCRHMRGRPNATVLLRLWLEGTRLHMDVIDSGPGIDRADARIIFKPFRRGRRADATAQGGIGLGLALARDWASLLGGRLDLAARHHPELGGAHFRLSVPAQIKS